MTHLSYTQPYTKGTPPYIMLYILPDGKWTAETAVPTKILFRLWGMKYIPVAQRINNRNNNALVNGAKQIVPIHAIDQGIVFVIAYLATGNKFISLERRGVGWNPANNCFYYVLVVWVVNMVYF